MRTFDKDSLHKLYLRSFTFPRMEGERYYPYSILKPKRLGKIEFDPITIFYGSNGSGKSTILNIIARKLGIYMLDRGNDAQYLNRIISECSYESRNNHINDVPDEDWGQIPSGSRFIRSEEVMHGMTRVRKRNEMLKQFIKDNDPEVYDMCFVNPSLQGDIRLKGMSIYDYMDKFQESQSNGELAVNYFWDNIEMNALVLLDEPENSLAPKFQKKLAGLIAEYARFFKSQFILATHSPFFLSINGAKIINLDEIPARVCKVNELETIRLYKELFETIG